MSLYNPKFTCPRCGGAVPAIFRCPERKHGICPYVRGWKTDRKDSIFGVLLLSVFAGLFTAGLFQTTWLLLVVPISGLLLWLATEQVQLFDPRAGVAVERTTVAGLEIKLRVMKKRQALSIPLKPVHPLHYPLSIVAVAERQESRAEDDQRAARVFRAALMDLLIKDLIEIQPISLDTSYVQGRRGLKPATGTEHAILDRSGGSPHLRVEGLEGDILRTITGGDWKESGRNAWLDGPRVYDLVRAYFEKDLANPHRHILQSVQGYAAMLGLCKIEKTGFWGFTRKVIWEGQNIGDLWTDCLTAQELEQEISRLCPEVWDGLLSQISEGIKSRIESGD